MNTDALDPRRRPVLVVSGIYVFAHLTTVATLAVVYGSETDRLVASGAATLPYALLTTAFTGVIVALSARSLSRRWWFCGAALLGGVSAARLLLPAVGGLLTVLVVFAVVLLPVVVSGCAFLRLVIVRLPSRRLAALPRRPETTRFLFVVCVLLLSTTGGSVVATVTAPPPVPPVDWAVDRQLAYLEDSDQSDRRTGAFVDSRRDYQRAERVLMLLSADRVDRPADALDAAVVLHHGTCPAHFELAHRLATIADDGGIENADQWVRLTYDRWQLSLGNPQQYGTQTGSPSVSTVCAPPIPSELNVSAPLEITS
jgi:hypothetical protein